MADIIRLTPLGAFSDNYIWVLHDARHAVAVDPGDAAPLMAFLDASGLALTAIWLTHHHADHVGGVAALRQRWPQATVYGPHGIAGVDRVLDEGAHISAFGQHATIWSLPGHTAVHLAYLWQGHVFCGDTLFAAGCGRVFDGTPAQLHHSLQRLASLPDDTLLYPAHEYTLANLQFALAVEPDNPALPARLARDTASRTALRPTLPCRLGDERDGNPFLRCHIKQVRAAAEKQAGHPLIDDEAVFVVLRQWKNIFRAA